MIRTAISAMAAACLAAALSAVASSASAATVTYTGFTLANGKIGSWSFTNAQVTITFVGDPANVQAISYGPPLYVDLSFIGTGSAKVTIVKGDRSVTANFAPNLLFVSMDQDNGGVGFGIFDSSGLATLDHIVSPTYPLGICCGGGSVDISFNAYGFASPELAAMPIDLAHDSSYSGRAYICPTFPSVDCFTPPTIAMPTDKGNLYLFAPYVATAGTNRPQNAGFFTAVVAP